MDICPSRTFTGQCGMIRSPNYPEDYPPNTMCDLEMEVTAGYKVQITFVDLQVEPPNVPGFCTSDYVEVSYLIITPYR